MAKGIFRLLLVLFAVCWIGAVIVTYLTIEEDRWQLDSHLSPYLRGELSDYPPSELSWPVYSAMPEFLSLSLPEREVDAKKFYQKNIAYREPTWQLAPLEEWIVESSQYSVQEAPIRTFVWKGGEVNYRDFDHPGIWNHPKASYIVSDSNTLLMALFFWLALASILAVIFFTTRWVIRGFQRR